MIRQCCACRKIFRDGEWVALDDHGLGLDPERVEITHGYCDDCARELRASAQKVHALLDPEPTLGLISRT